MEYHSNDTSHRRNIEKGNYILIYGNENAGLKIMTGNDLLVNNVEGRESCVKNVCVVEFGVHITYLVTFGLECNGFQKWFLF